SQSQLDCKSFRSWVWLRSRTTSISGFHVQGFSRLLVCPPFRRYGSQRKDQPVKSNWRGQAKTGGGLGPRLPPISQDQPSLVSLRKSCSSSRTPQLTCFLLPWRAAAVGRASSSLFVRTFSSLFSYLRCTCPFFRSVRTFEGVSHASVGLHADRADDSC